MSMVVSKYSINKGLCQQWYHQATAPPKLSLLLGDLLPSNTFLGPTQVHNPNGTSNNSAVFAELTVVSSKLIGRPCYEVCSNRLHRMLCIVTWPNNCWKTVYKWMHIMSPKVTRHSQDCTRWLKQLMHNVTTATQQITPRCPILITGERDESRIKVTCKFVNQKSPTCTSAN